MGALASGAATAAFNDETGADSVSIPSGGGSSFKTCASVSYTNTGNRAVVVQWMAEVTGLHFSSYSGSLDAPSDYVSATWVFESPAGSPVQTDAAVDTSAEIVQPEAANKAAGVRMWQRTLAAGDSCKVLVSVGGVSDDACTIAWARTRLVVTILKA